MTHIPISLDIENTPDNVPYTPCVIPTFDENNTQCRDRRLFQEYKFATDQTNAISIISIDGFFTYVNDEYCRVLEYESGEIVGKYLDAIIHPDISGNILEYILDTNQEKKMPWKGMIKITNKKEELCWFKTKMIPIFDETGKLIEYFSIGNDMTETYVAEEELRKSFVKLQELDEKKDEFINIASHELRTPMTAISGYISMILDGDAGEISSESRMYLEQVYKSSKQLVTLINDMLDIAKLESGKGKLYYEDIEVRSFIGDVIGNLKPLALLKKQNMEIQVDYGELTYRTDNRKFQQVLINIVGNALKYTPEGGHIKLHSWIAGTDLFVRVTDTGIGIPEKQLTHIFEKFAQVKNPLTRDINGTGLGLAITKTIVEKFLGTITVESEEGKGSVFTIQLPLQAD